MVNKGDSFLLECENIKKEQLTLLPGWWMIGMIFI